MLDNIFKGDQNRSGLFGEKPENSGMRGVDGDPVVSINEQNVLVDKVSAIVVSFYTGPVLARAIASLKEQAEIQEIIIVDNGNWDNAVLEAANINADEDQAEAEIKIISGHGNIGFSAACNLGAKHAKSPLLLFLNPDAVLPQESVKSLLEGRDAIAQTDNENDHAAPWMMGAKLVGPDGLEQTGARRHVLTPWRAFVEATKLYRLAPEHPYFRRFNMHDDPCPGELCTVPVTSGACFLIPREDYFYINGMDEKYFLHVEDIDFCLRFAKAGGRVYYNPKVEVLHFKGSSRIRKSSIEFYKTQGMQLYFEEHFNDVYPPLFLPFVNMLMWVRFGLYIVRDGVMRTLSFLGLRKRRGRVALVRARALASRQVIRK